MSTAVATVARTRVRPQTQCYATAKVSVEWPFDALSAKLICLHVDFHFTARCPAWELYGRLLWGRVAGGVLWHVRAYGANCQLTAKQAQANNVTQTNSHNQPEREVNQKQNAGRKLAAPFYWAARTNRSRAHCPLILFAYPDFMLLLFDFYACRYFHFCN